MPRLPVLGRAGIAVCLLGLCPLTPARAQEAPTANPEVMSAQPADALPAPPAAEWIEDLLPEGDSLSDQDLALRMARLYARQAELMEAEAIGDDEALAELLDATMQDLQQLGRRPGVGDQRRFRELYRSLLTEYEHHRGPAPELAFDRGEIFELREAMFAALDGVDDPLMENVDLPSSVMATFPMTVNRAVENQLRFYLRKRGHLARVRQRAETYFPMIEQILAEEGVPDELKYLAVIESALNSTARSWAGAAGMWQFIPATGRHSGLTVTRGLDERLDPEKATRAAARHLKELYAMFGDWQLAISGYNCNPAKIRREIRRAEARNGRPATFWDIYNHIPRETRAYIPSYIAVALIMANPDAFDLPPVEPGPRYEFDVMAVKGGTTLGALADKAGTDLRTLRALNPAFRKTTVPQWADGYEVRLPAGHYARHQRDLAAHARQADGLVPRTVAYSGMNRRVIAFAELPQNGRRVQSGPSAPMIPVQQVADGVRRGQSVAPEAAPSAQPQTERVRYRVRRGDTLIRIARKHGVTVRQLREWNGISGSKIRIGQRLTIHKRAGSRRS